MKIAYRLFQNSIFQSLVKLGEEHRDFLSSKDQNEISNFNKLLAELSEDERNNLPEKVETLSAQIDVLNDFPKQREKHLYEEIDRVLDSAYLMPFQTRDLAEQYLATRQPDFKVGLFFQAKN